MNPKTFSITTLSRLFAVLVGLIILAGCGGGSGGTTNPGSPAVTLSTSTLTFTGQGVNTTSAAQSVTVTNSGTATLTFSGVTLNGTNPDDFAANSSACGTSLGAGSACNINVTFTPAASGTRTATLSIADNASNSPQTVALTGTGSSVSLSSTSITFSNVTPGTTSSAQFVTLTNNGGSTLTITSITVGGTNSADFTLASGAKVCPYSGGSVAAAASCTVYVTFSPPVAGTFTGTVSIADSAAGSPQTVTLTGTTTGSNTATVSVNLGPTGNYTNGIFTTVTLCSPGSTTNCATIPDVLVDTGSVGLRVLSSGTVNATAQVASLNLPQVIDSVGNPLYGCVQYGDLSYNWGPMQMATVQIGGETASQIPTASGGTANSGIPIQVITAGGTAPSGADCAAGGGGSDNSVQSLGANGILGVGNYLQDCGAVCTGTPNSSPSNPWPYIGCNSSGCGYASATLAQQAWNPVAAFSGTDTNGVLLQLPSVPAVGQATATGTLYFGIGTQSNNQITNQTIYEFDTLGNFQTATLNGVSYTSSNSYGSFLDSGSNGLFISDPTTLGTIDCGGSSTGYYCPSSTLNLSLVLQGINSTTSPTLTLSIANALTLINTNPTFAAFNDIGGTGQVGSGTGSQNDWIDLGLPFFYGRSIFVGIEGTNNSAPNGYWAF